MSKKDNNMGEKYKIEVANFKFSYDGRNEVLHSINMNIKEKEVTAFIGPSGCGKSTFLRCLNLLEIPTGGKVYFEGIDITNPKVDINKHRQKMGMVFQQFNLFPHKTVLNNMILGPIQLLTT